MLREGKGYLDSWMIWGIVGFRSGRFKTQQTFKWKREKTCFENTIEFLAKGYWVKMCQNIFCNVIWCAMKPISKLLESLKHVITWNLDTPDTDDVDISKTYIVSATELRCQWFLMVLHWLGRWLNIFVILMKRINKTGTGVNLWQCLGKTNSRSAILISQMWLIQWFIQGKYVNILN